MANIDHVKLLLRGGVGAWNDWRRNERDILPDLSEANLSRAHLSGASLVEADLSGANLFKADLTRAELGAADLTGTKLREADLRGANLVMAGLVEADLRKADLRWVNLRSAVLHEADLRGAKLTGADLHEANLGGAKLYRAVLREANLSGARLLGADLSEADLFRADLRLADFSGARLVGTYLSGATCIGTNLSGATLTGCNVYGIAAWDLNLEGAIQDNLRITSLQDKADITVDNLEVAQFLNLLLHNEKMRAVLDTITSKVVLILGRFSDERKPVLDALREALRRHSNGYIPVLFDFEPQVEKPVLETVKTLANLARFVIADLTDPHMIRAELTAIVPHVPTVPIQPIIEGDADLPTEYESWALYKSFLPVRRYVDLTDLLANLNESVLAPVEAHVHARRLST